MAIREGRWDCPSCGRKAILGSKKFCGSCGHPRGDDVEFYLPEDAGAVTDPEEIRKAQAGPDWTCSYCGTNNPGGDTVCSSCGAPSAEAESRRATREIRDDVPPPLSSPTEAPSKAPQVQKPVNTFAWIIGGGVAVAVIVFLFFLFTGTSQAELPLAEVKWTRSIAYEELRTLTQDGWQDEIPGDARILSTNREIRRDEKVQTGTQLRQRTVTKEVQVGTQEVKVGTRDMGNGFFEDIMETRPVYEEQEVTETYEEPIYREDPVYDTKVLYEVDRWEDYTTDIASGQDQNPLWPPASVSGDKIRESSRSEEYNLGFDNGEKILYYTTNLESEFKAYSPGQLYSVEVNNFGVVVAIEP